MNWRRWHSTVLPFLRVLILTYMYLNSTPTISSKNFQEYRPSRLHLAGYLTRGCGCWQMRVVVYRCATLRPSDRPTPIGHRFSANKQTRDLASLRRSSHFGSSTCLKTDKLHSRPISDFITPKSLQSLNKQKSYAY